MNYLAIIVVLVVVAAFVWGAHMCNQGLFEDFLEGVWSAVGTEYCAEADIQAMMLTIGPASDRSRLNPFAEVTRPAHLVIMDDKHSGSFDLKYTPEGAWPFSRVYTFKAKIIPSDLGVGDDPVWDGPLNITVDIARGHMVIVDANNEVAAILSKDNAITEACLPSD